MQTPASPPPPAPPSQTYVSGPGGPGGPGGPAPKTGGNKTPLVIGAIVVVLALIAGAVLLLSGGDDEKEAADEPTATTVANGGDESAAGAVSSIDGLEKAVVQIEATGTFRDPEEGEVANAAGRGSGFIIDPSGIAVTNNHVVTGAATLKVFVSGEDQPRNAKVLGVSECNDLAVIDIDGDGFSHVTWYEGEVKAGLPIWLAGFPLGDPEYTLTQGIIAKAEREGETSWASLDYTLQHDAAGQPGNSGGGVFTEDAKVVGVHYADYTGGRGGAQFLAIPGAIARPVVEQMRQGEDVESIGVNGSALVLEDGTSGVWVASVKSGSPASDAGIKAGDIITKLEGLVLSTDGTMSDYCDVLRTHNADDELAVQVLRYDTEEVLEGKLNGAPLELAFSFAQEFEEETDSGATASYSGYRTVVDGGGQISVDVPNEWAEVNTEAEDILGIPSPSIWAAPQLQAFLEGWDVPGLKFAITDQVDPNNPDAIIDAVAEGLNLNSACTTAGRQPYSDALYAGKFERWDACGGTATQYFIIVASPEDRSFTAIVEVQVVSDADLEALDTIIQTFQRIAVA